MKVSKNVKIGYGVLAVLFVVMFLLYKVSLNVWGSYAIGKIYRINTARGGTTVSYKFMVKGEEYGGMISEPMRDENVGKPYFIHYLNFIPSINLLLPDKPADSCYNRYNNKTFDTIPICSESR